MLVIRDFQRTAASRALTVRRDAACGLGSRKSCAQGIAGSRVWVWALLQSDQQLPDTAHSLVGPASARLGTSRFIDGRKSFEIFGDYLEIFMTISKWCVLIACFLPVLTALLPKLDSLKLSRRDGKYDNLSPREWESRLSGWQQRAIAAHSNGFEILPLFVGSVVFAHIAQADQSRIDMLAMAFVALRVAYVAVYLMNLGALRTLVWSGGIAACIALMLL
jgi:uncharacterized MAPEG superfamily protein